MASTTAWRATTARRSHLAGLAERLNAAIEQLRERFGEIGDQRLTVMAAITFADQAAEATRRVVQLEHELAESEKARETTAERGAVGAESAASAILAVAERIESLAGKVGGSNGARTNGAAINGG